MSSRVLAASAFLIPTLALSACFWDEPVPLPEGEQTVEGILIRAQLSLVRRGSHLLRRGDTEDFYVESTSVNLRDFEGRSVALRGMFERNTDPDDKPVFVVSAVLDAEDQWKEWNFPGLGLSLKSPLTWEASFEDGIALFRQTASGDILLRIERHVGDTPESGVPLVLGTADAVRFTTEAGGERIFVLHGERTIRLDFTPPPSGDLAPLREEWLTVLRSVSFTSATRPTATGASVSSSATPLFGTGAGVPCGGPAGILCSPGYYCQITDTKESIGKCRAR